MQVRLKQRMAQMRSRQSQDVLRTPSARRVRRSIRSGYAFAHQEGFGRLITSGKIMKKMPNGDFISQIPGMGRLSTKNSGTNNGATKSPNTAPPSSPIDSDMGMRAPTQDLNTVNL